MSDHRTEAMAEVSNMIDRVLGMKPNLDVGGIDFYISTKGLFITLRKENNIPTVRMCVHFSTLLHPKAVTVDYLVTQGVASHYEEYTDLTEDERSALLQYCTLAYFA